jgi:anti-sigma28 factor (negative regulator of flagellin synthesis)
MTSEKHPAAESKAILTEKTDTEHVKGARNKDTHKGLSKPQLQAQKMSRQSYITIHKDIKEELRKGNYKVNIAPSDLHNSDYRHHKHVSTKIILWVSI